MAQFEDDVSRKRGDSGRYTETIDPSDVLTVFETVEGPVITSGDVSEQLDCSRETARRKLRRLEDRGIVASRRTGGSVVWWRLERDNPADVDADDPFWELEPGASGESDGSERVDAILYGES